MYIFSHENYNGLFITREKHFHDLFHTFLTHLHIYIYVNNMSFGEKLLLFITQEGENVYLFLILAL